MEEPQITVGILSGKEIEFSFPESFTTPDGTKVSGAQKAVYQKEKIYWSGKEYDELIFYPQPNAGIFFELKDVTIGINFHWERKEVQRFQGALKIIVEGETLTAINVISIADYLTSVISSEMSATASLELLKAHAVISRSWLINKLRVENEKWKATIQPDSAANSPHSTLHSQLIKWYDHEAHTHFDVCADDHCQRYQGITRASTPQAIEAVSATRGEVLMYEGKICDARFSKCCGGAMEEFQNCWENVRHPYLTGKRDYIPESHASDSEKQITGPAIQLPDLTQEEEAAFAKTSEYVQEFERAMDDDFNTADAIASVFDLVKYINTTADADKSKEFLQNLFDLLVKLTDVLGLIVDKKEEMLAEDIEKMIEERQAARKAKDFARADAIRDELLAKGIVLEDTREGVKWKKA